MMSRATSLDLPIELCSGPLGVLPGAVLEDCGDLPAAFELCTSYSGCEWQASCQDIQTARLA